MGEGGPTTIRLQGIGASPGIAIGRAFLLDRRQLKTPQRHIPLVEVEAEVARLRLALDQSDAQLLDLKRKLAERQGEDHFRILEAHRLILKDEQLVADAMQHIREEHVNAEWALQKTVERIQRLFELIEDEYFRERRSDVAFVSQRILRNLLGLAEAESVQPPPDAVVVARDLSPADTVQLHRAAVAAFATDAGGRTSHSAILARALQIPAVVALEDLTTRVGNGDLVIVDGIRGEVMLFPPPSMVAVYRAQAGAYSAFELGLLADRHLPALTRDGTRVALLANIEVVEEVPSALGHGAEGIGLFRTEFMYLDRPDLPSEDEHYEQARSVLEQLDGRTAILRTFDLGADKLAQPFCDLRESNPALGLRSTRLCLRERGLFKTQLRGILRASAHGKLRLMLPMISGLSELRQARAVIDEVREELHAEGQPFDAELPVGVMVEMPAAALCADLLARESAFFSIGTNDLIQYTLAVDRANENVGHLFTPFDPAILRLVRTVVEAGHAAGIPVGMCGEMAGEPRCALLLLGLGLDELSMNPTAVPLVKAILRDSHRDQARTLAAAALEQTTALEVEQLIDEQMSARFPERLLHPESVWEHGERGPVPTRGG